MRTDAVKSMALTKRQDIQRSGVMPADVAADGESYPLTEIDRAIDKMVKDRAWGQIQIDFQHGRPVVVRTTVTENLKANEENKLYEYRKRQNIGTDTF